MPSYNVAKWVGLSIETLKLQSYENFECVIIDDCSTDNTNEVVKKYIEDDDRFHLRFTAIPKEAMVLLHHLLADA